MKRVLFVLKKNGYGISSGLLNSAEKNAQALIARGHEAKVVMVIDNNEINHEVSQYKPTHVIIEALWVVPEKIKVLTRLHRNVSWIVCVHSKAPFLANEGIAMQWIHEYLKIASKSNNFKIACNNKDFYHDLATLTRKHWLIAFLPNMYSYEEYKPTPKGFSGVVDVGCFGSLRPMKNHLEQAVAMMIWAKSIGKQLRFHINSSGTEQGGENVLTNLRGLFYETGHKLVEHNWMPHDKFTALIRGMDIGIQVSMSESFNVVTADFVLAGVPMIVSDDIKWMPRFTRCCPTDTHRIISRVNWAYSFPCIFRWFSQWSLRKYNKWAGKQWDKILG